MRQVLGPAALGRPRGIEWRGRWEGGSGWGTHVNPWLIQVNVWQKPLQYCKVISLQLIKINGKKKSKSILSLFWKANVQNQFYWPEIKVSTGPHYWGLRGGSFLTSSSFQWLPAFLACGYTTLISTPSLWVCEWLNTHGIKFTILTILKCIVSGIQYIHIVVQPSPPSIFRTFSFSQNEALYPLNSNSPFPPPPAPGNHHCTFHLYELDYSRVLV